MLFHRQRPVMNRVATPAPWYPLERKIVPEEQYRAPPFPRRNRDDAGKSQHANDGEIGHRCRQYAAPPPHVEALQANASKHQFFFQQPGTDQESTDGKEQTNAVWANSCECENVRVVVLSARYRVVQDHRQNGNRSPAIQCGQIALLQISHFQVMGTAKCRAERTVRPTAR